MKDAVKYLASAKGVELKLSRVAVSPRGRCSEGGQSPAQPPCRGHRAGKSCPSAGGMGRQRHCRMHGTAWAGGSHAAPSPAAFGWQGLLRFYSACAACNFGLLKS